MMQTYFFYPWNETISEYRFMCSWDTTENDINDFISLLKRKLLSIKLIRLSRNPGNIPQEKSNKKKGCPF
jgi:hypothetical protein